MARLALKTTAAGLLMLALPLACPEAMECPFEGKKPPIEQLLQLRGPLPPFCGADLHNASLAGANLAKVNLIHANLQYARLEKAILTGADLTGADLSGASLIDADLSRAELGLADFTSATLLRAKLIGAFANRANFTRASLERADLTDAVINEASFLEAYLGRSNLTNTDVINSDFTGATLTGTDLTRTDLVGADLSSVIFEPDIESLSSTHIELARNLSLLRFRARADALAVLRERFAKQGLRDQEREVTFAKLKTQRLLDMDEGSASQKLGATFSYVAFELSCGYGLHYGRPLKLLGVMIMVFAIVYACALHSHGSGGLWRVWQPDRILKTQGQGEPERLSWRPVHQAAGPPIGVLRRASRGLGSALLFSLHSAFQIGWRELNVGNWITRLQPREYTLRATGWVRVVSGVQSLLSVYLLALWVLSYFGRPFE